MFKLVRNVNILLPTRSFSIVSSLNLVPNFNIFGNKTIHEYIIIIKNTQHIKYIVTHIHVKEKLMKNLLDLKIYFNIFSLVIVTKRVTSLVFIEIVQIFQGSILSHSNNFIRLYIYRLVKIINQLLGNHLTKTTLPYIVWASIVNCPKSVHFFALDGIA